MSNDQALLKYNEEFEELYSIAFDRKRIQQIKVREITEKNIVELCDAISEMHLKFQEFGGWRLWYVTSQLLAGTVLYHQRQVDLVHEESRQLQQRSSGRFFILQKTQTIKRRTQEIHTKNKRKRLVDEEITTNVFVWNSNECQHDENDNNILSELNQPDPCMRAQNEITLREIADVDKIDEREQSVFSQIEDFGEAFAEERNVFMSPGPLDSTISETSGSIFSEPHVHEAIDYELSQLNNGRQNGENGKRNPSGETIPSSLPAGQDVHSDRIRVLTKKEAIVAPFAAQAIRDNDQSPLKPTNDTKSSPRVANQFPTSLMVDHSIPSQPEDLNIFASQTTDDRNDSATPAVLKPNGEVPMQRDGVENARSQPNDIQTEPEAHVGEPTQGRDGNVRILPNGINLSEIELEPEFNGEVTMQQNFDNIQAQPIDISTGQALPASPIAADIANPTANALDIIEPLLVELDPVVIAPPLLEVSQAVNISPKRQRRAASKKKSRVPRFDETITLDPTELRARIEIATIDCLPLQSCIISKAERFRRKEATFFVEPTIAGQCNRQLFKRNLVQFDEENDLSIIHAILGLPENDRPLSVEDKEQESHVIEGDTVRRRSSRKRKSPVVAPQEQHEIEEIEEAAFPSPLGAMDGLDLQLTEPPAEQMPRNSPIQADASLSDNDKMVLRKLKGLWKENGHPIAMTNIISPKNTRLQAAKDFASILSLKKLRLIEVEADKHGKIQHIAKGIQHTSQTTQ